MPEKPSDLTHCLYLVSLPTALGSVFFCFCSGRLTGKTPSRKHLCAYQRANAWKTLGQCAGCQLFFEEHMEGGVFRVGERMSFLSGEAGSIGGVSGSSVQT